MLIHRAEFSMTLLGSLLRILFYIIFFELIFAEIEQLGGWSKAECYLWVASFNTLLMLGDLFMGSFTRFSQDLRRGQIDLSLTKPCSFQVITFFKEMKLDSFVNIFLVAGLVFYANSLSELQFTSLNLLGAGLFFVLATWLYYSMHLFIYTHVFYFERLDNLEGTVWHISQASRYPRQIYTGLSKLIFWWILPVASIVSIPTELALGVLTSQNLLIFLGLCVIFSVISNVYFRFGIKHYNSAN